SWAITLGSPSANGIDVITAKLEPRVIDLQFMRDAIRLWRDFFWPHARAAMRQIGLSDRHRNARRVLRWIIAHNKREIAGHEIRQNALAKSLDAEQTQDLLNSLERAGWLKAETIKTSGRPKLRWTVNSQLFSSKPVPESPETPESQP